MALGDILVTILGLAFFAVSCWAVVQVWRMAEAKNRNPGAWVLLGFLITPFVAYFILLSMRYREPWEK
jgi:type VI protein secretion system component VasK